MEKYKYKMSIIMPIYNMEKYLDKALESVINQDFDFKKIQIVAVNDGSKDSSIDILNNYASRYDNIKVIDQENQGLSKTRNNGIKESLGKYIMFLDPDDTISNDTVSSLVNFFDKHYDEIDLVAYKIVPVINGKESKKLHYRYEFLTKTGIYDLKDKDYRYSCITTINYCIKNKGKDNIYFDTTPNFRHEDQKFAIDVIFDKMKIGYVSTGTYYYLQQPNSVTHTYFYAYYLFDKAMAFWEEEFNKCGEKVHPYIQAMFISDINWKTMSDILKPYHYQGKKYDEEYGRILKLLNKVDDSVLLRHPAVSKIYKYYFIKLKNNNNFRVENGSNISYLSLFNNDELIYSTNQIALKVLRFNVKKNIISFAGYIIDPILDFVEKPELYVVTNHNYNDKIKVKLKDSSYDYFRAKEKITKTWFFEIDIDITKASNVNFDVKINDALLNTKLEFSGVTPFNENIPDGNVYYCDDKKIIVNNDSEINSNVNNNIIIQESTKKQKKIHNKIIDLYYYEKSKKVWLFRKMLKIHNKFKSNKRIWIYYDCKGVEKDNAYYQFIHDLKEHDGVKRYYISANPKNTWKNIFNSKELRNVVSFRSIKHKFLYADAEKIVTAFIENNNCSPYTFNSLKKYADLFTKPRIIYLQHGVLHAHTPWKYSYDRYLVEKEVISTEYERKNLIKNYFFDNDHLLDAGMPRYDYISQDKKSKKKILFAPSWRNYLISNIKGEWKATDEMFENSNFYKETYEFLSSKELKDLLEKYDYTLDFKLHPIFNCYKKFYELDNKRIKIDNFNSENSDYSVFITDYSSFVYDFVYLKRNIFYFFPDYDLFKAGLNGYRELDLPLEDGFGKLCIKSVDALKNLEAILKNNCEIDKKYKEKNMEFFIHNDNEQCQRIYDEIK